MLASRWRHKFSGRCHQREFRVHPFEFEYIAIMAAPDSRTALQPVAGLPRMWGVANTNLVSILKVATRKVDNGKRLFEADLANGKFQGITRARPDIPIRGNPESDHRLD